MPLSCCSITCVTEFSTVSAEAPVYVVPIVTLGGAMSGYCSSGSVKMDKPPASMMTMASTHAKMGRLMKKGAMVRVCSAGGIAGRGGRHRSSAWSHGRCRRRSRPSAW